jgi:hypothetical protein
MLTLIREGKCIGSPHFQILCCGSRRKPTGRVNFTQGNGTENNSTVVYEISKRAR